MNMSKGVAHELHCSARRTSPRRKTIELHKDVHSQADLVYMKTHAKVNNNYKYLLTIIDVYSKFARAQPVLDKKGNSVTEPFTSLLKIVCRKHKLLQTDRDKEFYNKIFHNLLEKKNIRLYSTYSALIVH